MPSKSARFSGLFCFYPPVAGAGGPICARRRGFRRAGVQLGIWVGLMAGPVLFPAHADKPGRSHVGARGVQSDILPRTVVPATEAPADLKLQKEGDKKADALAAFAEGLAAEENADYERALEAYRRSLALDASNIELAIKVAFNMAERGDVPQGIGILKDAAKTSPKEFLPPLCLSQLYGKYLKKQDLAEKYALTALNLEPASFPCYAALVEIYTATAQPKKVEATLQRASQVETQDPAFWLQLVEACMKLPASPERDSRIVAALDKTLANAKDNLAAVAKAADAYVLLKRLDNAVPLYRKALEQSRKPRSEETQALRDKLARALLATGKRDEAIAVIEKGIEAGAANYESYEFLGELHALSEDLDKAVEAYQQALRLDSSQPKSYWRIGQLQLQLKKPEDAVKTFTEARAKFPRFPEPTYWLAVALTQAKQYATALALFEQAEYEGKNSSESLFSSEFYFNWGTTAEQAGKLELAAEKLRKCIEIDPSNAAQAYNYLGYMWADKGENLPEALELIKQALVLSPEEGAYLDSLGWCYFRMGDFANAVTHLRQAAEKMQPQEAVIFDHLGDALAATGQTAEALENWKKALALEPDNAEFRGKVEKAEKAGK